MELLVGCVVARETWMSRRHSTSQPGKALFSIMLMSTLGDFKYTKKADMHYMYGRASGDGRAALRMYHAKFPD
ncbi:hypothetical protein TNCV_606341 [Trichonephila clavipes]|nr:hypothetical protein TNCV_606341 [Trichonephila clavipes]